MLGMKMESPGDVVMITVSDEVRKEDYAEMLPKLESLIEQHGKVSVLLDIEHMTKVDPAALWRDAKFTTAHLKSFKRVAVVGDSTWERMVTGAMKALTPFEIKFFGADSRSDAETWVRGDANSAT